MAHPPTPALNPAGRLWLLGTLLALTAPAQQENAGGWLENLHLTATGTVSWVNNASRTSAVANRKDATTYELALSGTQPKQLARNLLLISSEEISALRVQDFSSADHVRAGARVALQHKFGLGPQATVLQASGGMAYKAADFAGDRGWTAEMGLQLAKRVLPNVRLAAIASWLEHGARSSVFDLDQHSLSFEASWDISDRWSLAGSATRLEGDIVANAAWPVWAQAIGGGFGPTVQTYYTSRPWVKTHIWGPDWVSYNVEADVDLWSVALSFQASDHTALELRKGSAYVINHIGIRYPTDSWSVGVNHRF
ncbi:MAG TPA: hypothetical protein VG734_21910 [Lacunisphaera sp.]|nr:hypothetical protein [Lacunisphaera sp.]